MNRISSTSVSTIIAFILICIGISSCSKSSHVISSNFIQKRKYTSGFFVNKHPNNYKCADKTEDEQLEKLTISHDTSNVEILPTEPIIEEITEIQEKKPIENKEQEVLKTKEKHILKKSRQTVKYRHSSNITVASKIIGRRFFINKEHTVSKDKPEHKLSIGFIILMVGLGLLALSVISFLLIASNTVIMPISITGRLLLFGLLGILVGIVLLVIDFVKG